MRYDTDRLIFSPSDLVVFLDSEFASWMDRWRIECSKNNEGKTNNVKLPLGVTHEGLACAHWTRMRPNLHSLPRRA